MINGPRGNKGSRFSHRSDCFLVYGDRFRVDIDHITMVRLLVIEKIAVAFQNNIRKKHTAWIREQERRGDHCSGSNIIFKFEFACHQLCPAISSLSVNLRRRYDYIRFFFSEATRLNHKLLPD